MKDLIKKYIKDFVKEYEKQESISTTWREPLVGFADVNSEEIKNIREYTYEGHLMPGYFRRCYSNHCIFCSFYKRYSRF